MNKLDTIKELLALIGDDAPAAPAIDNGMVNAYVIVRCRDAGVHAGVLKTHNGRECLLSDARRLWYWKPARGGLLSAVALYGLDAKSKVGAPIEVHLTETCEIIRCSAEAEASIRRVPNTHE